MAGEIGMSADLDNLAQCMFNGFVPGNWISKAPPSLKNLVNWIEHFLKRYQ
jgi:dynein heavy chain